MLKVFSHAFVLFLALTIAQCKSRDESAVSETTTSKVDHIKFRNIFLGAVRASYTADKFEQTKNNLIYVPSPNFLAEPDATSPTTFFSDVSKSVSGSTPMDLFKLGQQTPSSPFSMTEINNALIQARATNGEPMFVVIVPGIFGEFINTHAFEEIFANSNSNFRKRWLQLSPANVKMSSGGGTIGLDKLMVVGSIDDERQQSLVDVMLFNTPRLSLESMGTIAEQGEVFTKRLEASFQLLGRVPKNITLVGYSRGTMIALEMLSINSETLKNVKAVITVGGVVYGSALADELDKPETVSAKQVAAVNNLISDLEDGADWAELNLFQKNALVLRNMNVWGKFILAMMQSSAPDLGNLNLKAALAKAKGQLTDLFSVDMKAIWQMVAFFWAEFHLWDPFGEQYANNIAKFKKAAGAAIVGVGELSFRSRMKWWATHTIPSEGIRYYSITSTMSNEDPLRANPATEIPSSPDTKQLLASYDSYIAATKGVDTNGRGITINDSQVGANTARFWPKLAPMLNGKQAPLNTTFLGVCGTSHWGLALEEVTRTRDGAKNPFPRLALFKALAATVAFDQTTK